MRSGARTPADPHEYWVPAQEKARRMRTAQAMVSTPPYQSSFLSFSTIPPRTRRNGSKKMMTTMEAQAGLSD